MRRGLRPCQEFWSDVRSYSDHVSVACVGFTLVELLVTITVAGVLLAVAIPSFIDVTLGSKLGSYANNLVASVYLARSEAIKRNTPVTLCVSTNGTSCATGGWQQGWIVLVGTTVIQIQPALNGSGSGSTGLSGLKISEASSISSLTFQPTGVGATTAILKVCRATPTVGNQERVVTISLTGQATVAKTKTGVCP
jgi:type IV fimbrial biogenesis protein FimT